MFGLDHLPHGRVYGPEELRGFGIVIARKRLPSARRIALFLEFYQALLSAGILSAHLLKPAQIAAQFSGLWRARLTSFAAPAPRLDQLFKRQCNQDGADDHADFLEQVVLVLRRLRQMKVHCAPLSEA